jgi:hypothetical protein
MNPTRGKSWSQCHSTFATTRRFIQLSVNEQAAIADQLCAVEFQPHAGVKLNPQCPFFPLTHQISPFLLLEHRLQPLFIGLSENYTITFYFSNGKYG